VPAKLTTEQFVVKAKFVHGDLYDYSLVVYSLSNIPVIIICPVHGQFKQKPIIHLMKDGHGCQKCAHIQQAKNLSAFMQPLTTEEFIQKAIAIHRTTYDYSLVKYKNGKAHISIICKTHGKFSQTPMHHLQGNGCLKCANEKKTSSKEKFIEKAILVHGNETYDYSFVDYKHSKTAIQIVCKHHGSFWQTPSNHLTGRKCKQCARQNLKYNLGKHLEPLTMEEFLFRAKETHGDKYDYSLINIPKTKSIVSIICKKHGIFGQAVYSHLRGVGCPSCGHLISKPEQAWLNSLDIPLEHRQYPIKVGSKIFKVDGFDPTTNTIYEFYGDYWHGNPAIYSPSETNSDNKRTFGDLYQETIRRETILRNSGYKLIIKWETNILNPGDI